MTNKEIRRAIDARLSLLTVSKEMEGRILSRNRKRNPRKLRPALVAMAACLCVLLAIPALAAAIPGFRKFLGAIRSDVVQLLQPVELASESSGIRMEVLAAMNDDESVVAYITMRDISGGQMNGKVDLYDYHISGLNIFTHSSIAQADPQTALLRIVGHGGSGMDGRKVTLQVDSFLSGTRVLDAFDTEVDLSQLSSLQGTSLMGLDEVNGGGGEELEAYLAGQDSLVLAPGQQRIPLPGADFAVISGIGILDGKLHMQVMWPEKLKRNEHIDDHGWFYLENDAGKRIPSSCAIYFRHKGIAYTENIFATDNPAGYRLYADLLTTNERFVRGDWQVTFPVNAVKAPQTIRTDLELGGVHITSMSLSPLGVTLTGTGEAWPEEMKVAVLLKGGGEVALESVVDQNNDGAVLRKYLPGEKPLETEDVEAVLINGVAYRP